MVGKNYTKKLNFFYFRQLRNQEGLDEFDLPQANGQAFAT